MLKQKSIARGYISWDHVPSRTIGALLLLLLYIGTGWAQTDTARLQGSVTDTTGAIMPGVTVTATNVDTNRSVAVQTKETGDYSIPALPIGRYKIEAKQSGFKPVTREVTLQISQIATVNIQLEPGDITETVAVTAGAPLVETASSAIGEIIQGRQVTELPLNGRNFTQLATLVPGVTRGVPDGDATGAKGNAETFRNGNTGGAALSVNGLRPQANNFTLDGVDNNESLVNTIIFFPPAEAIQEFRVQTSVAPAEFGRAGGALVSTSIRSGTNELHGSAFEFLRNSALDARPTFAPVKEPFRRNQFGGTLGGPVLQNKLFFFADYQGLRQFLPLQVDRASVPTPEFRRGDFSALLDPARSGLSGPIVIRDPLTGQPFPGNIVPPDRISRVGQNYLNAFPLPNTGGGRVQQNYITQRKQIQKFNDFDVRIDWNMGNNDFLFGRFSYGQDSSTTSSRLPALPAGFGSGANFNHPRGAAIGQTHIINSNLINEFRFGFIRVFYGYAPPFQDKKISADLGIPNANTSALLGGGALIGGGNTQLEYTGDFGPYFVPQNAFQYADTLSYIRGAHNVRFGGNLIRRQVNLFRPNRGKGFFNIGPGTGNTTGYEVSELLVGFIDNYTIGPPFGMVGTRSWEISYFVQDDWKVSRHLTLNLGLRYDLYTWPTEVKDRQANFDIGAGQLRVAGQRGNSHSLINLDKNNFAPRIGFAYDPWGDGKTVLRGGYGVFYFIDRGGIDNQLAQNPPFSGFSSFLFNDGVRITLAGRGPDGIGPMGNLDSRSATGPLPLGTLTGLDLSNPRNVTVFAAFPNNRIPYVQQWSLQVQRQLGLDTALNVAYVGTQGKKLATYYNLNSQAYNAPAGTRPFRNLGNVNVQETRGNSIYHALQTQLERRFAQGWQFLASYTWSHAIDDSTGAFDTTQIVDVTNFRLERSNSSLDVRHRFVFSSLYELPFGRGRRYGSNLPAVADHVLGGWQINGILTFQSGLPVNLSDPGNPNTRPDIIRQPVVFGNANPYFDRTAFARVPTNPDGVKQRPGTAGRNLLRGPRTRLLDFSLFKNFRITERLTTQFRTEFYNLTNTPQLAQPVSNITSGDFGSIRSTRLGTNRQIQFALRVVF